MSNSRFQPSPQDGLNLGLLTIANSTLLQIATVPVLVALVASKALSPTLKAISAASVEVFRGELLPILPFPEKNEEK
ncbi:hypothetical protein [Synechocystis sp. PCC 7509]|uniref:hypothetical protein n=1 Tax=Synechocystis sp. PCC 7509 TaxID=927677 RepID=UPI0002ABF32C|nr:hypothetical protein [Synechocystis sp. PCC 7509]